MAHIPKSILEQCPVIPGLYLRNRGKVRDSYSLPACGDKMLVVASNRISVFDFVLNALIPLKGEILTAMNHFWISLIGEICQTDFIATGGGIVRFLPDQLKDDIELQKSATVVYLLAPPEVEDVVRLYLTGSGWESYRRTGKLFEHPLPKGLIDGSKLPYPVYTPTTKAQEGHDLPMTADEVAKKYGPGRERMSLFVAGLLSSYAEMCGIILADTKFEFSGLLADEKGTPDSSRFWDIREWKKAHAAGKLPPSLDKQFVREIAKKLLIDKNAEGRKREPTDPADLDYVDGQTLPEDAIRKTTAVYRYIFWRLTGKTIERYQQESMFIYGAKAPRRRIEIILGSENDRAQAEAGYNAIKNFADVSLSFVSCHRNPEELGAFLTERHPRTDAFVAGAGKLAALAGDVKSRLCKMGRSDIPVIGVAVQGKTDKANQAAILSMEELPEQPVELDPNGNAYFGELGFVKACLSAVNDEFLPKGYSHKPAQIDVIKSY